MYKLIFKFKGRKIMECMKIRTYLSEKSIEVAGYLGDKPVISESTAETWHNVINNMVSAFNVSAGLIMRYEHGEIKIFLNSNNSENPYKVHEKHNLLSSLYMKTVIGNRGQIILNNLSETKPINEYNLNMNSYLGYPLLWPDGEVFGTICLLNNEERNFSENNLELMKIFKESIEKDLGLIFLEQVFIQEADERKRAEQKLLVSQKKYVDLFNNIRSSVLVFKEEEGGEDFIFMDLNEAAERTSAFNKNDIVGKSLSEVFPTIERTKLLRIMKEVLRTGKPSSVEVFYYKDERISGPRDNYHIYKTEDNYVVIIYDDTSESINYQKTIEENNKLIYEKKQYEEIRNEFFSNISHELRTPVNVISSAIQLMRSINSAEENENTFINKYLRIVEINCSRLQRTINNIIEMTEIEADFYDFDLNNIDIVKTVKDITFGVKDYLSGTDRRVSFRSDFPKKIIAGDKKKIEHILLNLLSNGVKFTGKGGKIDVKMTKNKDWIFISVIDNGIGVPDVKKDVIFQKFRQVDKSLNRSCEGSGIGLSLVKALVEKHQGKIHFTSTLGEGSEFVIQLPCIKIPNEIAADGFMNKSEDISLKEKIKIEFSDIYGLE